MDGPHSPSNWRPSASATSVPSCPVPKAPTARASNPASNSKSAPALHIDIGKRERSLADTSTRAQAHARWRTA
eukprot:1389409-Alexandrium_andersonii.AAC.1